MRSLYPGVSVALYYSDDPNYWHEAIIIYGSAEKCFHILTPDWDEYVEDVACVVGAGPTRAVVIGPAGECPQDLVGKFYRFASFPGEQAFRDKVMEQSRVESPAIPFPAKVRTMTRGTSVGPTLWGRQGDQRYLLPTRRQQCWMRRLLPRRVGGLLPRGRPSSSGSPRRTRTRRRPRMMTISSARLQPRRRPCQGQPHLRGGQFRWVSSRPRAVQESGAL